MNLNNIKCVSAQVCIILLRKINKKYVNLHNVGHVNPQNIKDFLLHISIDKYKWILSVIFATCTIVIRRQAPGASVYLPKDILH